MKFSVAIAVLALASLALANERLSPKDCQSILHAKKGYECHCRQDMTTVLCKSDTVRSCPFGYIYYDRDLQMTCSCGVSAVLRCFGRRTVPPNNQE